MEKAATPGRGKKFMKDLGIYAIGSLGSKLITFLLLPLYTFFITDPADFGYYDICLTIVFALEPLLGCQLSDGGFRFLIETDRIERQRTIITYVVKTLLRNSLILIGIGICVGLVEDVKYLCFIVAYSIVFTTYDYSNQLTRGLGQLKTYMSVNIFTAFAVACFSVLTVAVLGWGVPGLFIANIGARICSLIILQIRIGLFSKYITFRRLDKTYVRELLHYSLPLVPMMMLWYVLNSNNVFFIKHFLGLRENGIFAVLSKFAGIIFTLTSVFYQTWQQNAFEQYNTPDRNRFFTTILNNYILLLTFIASIFPYALRLVYPWIVGQEYQESSNYLSIVTLFTVGFSISAFLEVLYQCAKQTKRIMISVSIGIPTNILLNYLLVIRWGIYGIVISNVITYVVMIIYRAIDTRKYAKLSVHRNSVIAIAIMFGSGIPYYYWQQPLADIILSILIIAVFLLLLPKDVATSLKSRLKLN
ncbi:MAG: polysaccharide biosynthesis C-terminal domain-containing protein [Firmicutes bacterium]|nr:polysaccharide biosynthesis C-terminal domain-containing protein [Bacillota bacterium]MCM1401234.1 polysaccharide biosynthesis C-terminal domain-containing protein [Bacteroides sp.]